jgi:DNA-binding NarL/FixJ family response regulator
VDDHPIMREGLSQFISHTEDLEVCGESGDIRSARSMCEKLLPDLILMDISLGEANGLELIKDLHAANPKVLILALSMHDEILYAERVLRAGGRGYLMKEEGGEKLLKAIRHVLSGQIYVSEKMSSRILESVSSGKSKQNGSPLGSLTDREFEVFQLLGEGKSTQEIAQALHLSPKTVEVHRLHVKTKLGVRTASELIRYAVRWIETGNEK